MCDIPNDVMRILTGLRTSRQDALSATQSLFDALHALSAIQLDLPSAILEAANIYQPTTDHDKARLACKLIRCTKPGEVSDARNAAETFLATYFTKE